MFLPQLDYSLLSKRLQYRPRIIFTQPLYLISQLPKHPTFTLWSIGSLGKPDIKELNAVITHPWKITNIPTPSIRGWLDNISQRKQGNQPFSTSCSVCGRIPLWYHRIPAKVEGIQSTCTCLHVARVLKGRWISLPLAGTPQTEDLWDKTECHSVRKASKVSKRAQHW